MINWVVKLDDKIPQVHNHNYKNFVDNDSFVVFIYSSFLIEFFDMYTTHEEQALNTNTRDCAPPDMQPSAQIAMLSTDLSPL